MIELQPDVFSGLSGKKKEKINKELLNELAPQIRHDHDATESISHDQSYSISAVARPRGSVVETNTSVHVVGFSKYTKYTPKNQA